MIDIRPIILCGGFGSRLWPASRKSLPKQFIPLVGQKSLLDLTLSRCKKITLNKPIIVTNKNQSFLVDESLDKLGMDSYQILEKIGKNTCAAIYFASKLSSDIGKNEKLLIMPSDHLLDDKDFIKAIEEINRIDKLPNWMTLGMKIRTPSSGYGYIKLGEKKNRYHMVDSFIEKPDLILAKQMYESSAYYWNSGIFFGSQAKILGSISLYAKDIYLASRDVWKNREQKENKIILESEVIKEVRAESIDTAVLEKETSIGVYPYTDSWSDLGSWDTVSDNLGSDNKDVFEFETSNNFIKTDGRLTAVVGVKDVIVVNDDNVTLIAKKGSSESVKLILNKILLANKEEALEHSYEKRPWGKFENLLDSKKCKVKRLIVDPGKKLSLQYHHKRSENWVIVEGVATVKLDGEDLQLSEGDSIFIKKRQTHQLINDTKKPLVIIETQTGSYFGEDDIVRIEDPYNR